MKRKVGIGEHCIEQWLYKVVLLGNHIVTLVFFTYSSCIFFSTHYGQNKYSADILKVSESLFQICRVIDLMGAGNGYFFLQNATFFKFINSSSNKGKQAMNYRARIVLAVSMHTELGAFLIDGSLKTTLNNVIAVLLTLQRSCSK